MKTEIDRFPTKPKSDLIRQDMGMVKDQQIGQLREALARAFAASETDYAPLDVETVIARANQS